MKGDVGGGGGGGSTMSKKAKRHFWTIPKASFQILVAHVFTELHRISEELMLVG